MFDPRDDKHSFPKHEIFLGVIATAVRPGSGLPPLETQWDANHTLLLWLEGNDITSQRYDLQVVGTTALSKATR